MTKIRLNDGAEYDVIWCGLADGIWFSELADAAVTIPEAANVFSQSAATEKITRISDTGMENTYTGYTDLLCVEKDRYTGLITVRLQRPTQEG